MTWRRVDDHADPTRVARFLRATGRQAQPLRVLMHELLAPRPGERVLDVGSGTGEAALDAAAAVGPSGRVLGVDRSRRLTAEARDKAHERGVTNATFVAGDAAALALPDRCFDACRIERLLQHVEDPACVIGEVARVLRPGGRVVVMEPDWDAMIVGHPDRDLTARIVRVVADGIAQPNIGRQLARVLKDTGFVDVHEHLVGLPAGFVWFEHSRAIRQAVTDGRLDASRVGAWLDDGRRLDRAGRFFCRTIAFVASGRARPPIDERGRAS